MAMRGPWAISTAGAEFPHSTIKWCYCPMPPYTGKTLKFAAESGWGEVVNAKASAAVKQAAWKFIEFMERPENIILWNKATVTLPPLKSLRNSPQLLKVYPYLRVSFGVLPYGRWVGPVQDRDAMWGYVRDGLISVALHKQQPLQALQDVQKKINVMIDQHLGP
jgi:multiple sugar transport system substrate-binding protein